MDQKDKKPAQPQQGDKASNDRNPQQEQRDSEAKHIWARPGYTIAPATHPAATSLATLAKSRIPPACGWELPAQTLNCHPDRARNRFGILHHILIGEMQYDITPAAQIGIAPRVASGLHIVTVPVEFHHQPELAAEEIGIPRPHRHLPAELRA